MSWGGSEKNRWFQLDVSISMLWSSSGESHYMVLLQTFLYRISTMQSFKSYLDSH